MSRQVANVDIITDSFEVWLLQTNELLNAFSTEIITANTTYANTGNSTISRSAQLWGTFGSNNVVVTDSLRGGNINGLSANLLITTNATAYVAGADIRLLAGNSTSNSFLSPVGVHLGLGTANTVVNTNVIITQSSSIVNTNITPTRIQVATSTSTANITAISFSTGLFTGNTIAVSVGSNVVANSSALLIAAGSNTMILTEKTLTTAANLTVTNDKTTFSNVVNVTGNTILSNTLYTTGAVVLSNTITVTGNATLSNTITVTGNATLSNTLSVTGATTLSNTLTVIGLANASGNLNTPTANASVAVNVGANVNLTVARFNIGSSTVNTAITATSIDTDGTLDVLGATNLSNTLTVIGLANASGNLNTPTANTSVAVNVGANVNLTTTRINIGSSTVNTAITATSIDTDGTLDVLGATTLSNTLNVTGLTTTAGNINTPMANASVGINVGANVNLTTTRINIGTSTVNTFITSTAIETDGTLTVLGATTLSNTLSTSGSTTFQTDYVLDVASNSDVGSTIGSVLVYRFPKSTYASGKFEVQVKNGNTQLSELVLTHDGNSNAYITVYGTVASNGGSSPLGTFTANTDTANVNLYLVQTVANSSVKVIAHLIK